METGPSGSSDLTNSVGAVRIDSSSGPPQHAIPGVSLPQALEKQLLVEADEGSHAAGDVGTCGQAARQGSSVEEGAGSAAEERLQGRTARSAAGVSGVPVAASTSASDSPCTPRCRKQGAKPLLQISKWCSTLAGTPLLLRPSPAQLLAWSACLQGLGPSPPLWSPVWGQGPGSRGRAPRQGSTRRAAWRG